MVWRGSFLEIFLPNGKFLKRLGGLGEGPGEFSLILNTDQYDNQYYILDLKGLVSVFNADFTYQKRYYIRGEKNSNIIYDMCVGEGLIVTAQRWRDDLRISHPADDKVISLFEKGGRFIRSFFSMKEAWKKYPNDSLLGGNVLLIDDELYWTFKSINRIWQLSLDGQLKKEVILGREWWRSIIYDKRSLKRRAQQRQPIRRFYEEIWATGDMISDISYHGNNIYVHVLREIRGEARTELLVLDRGLNNEAGPYTINGYLLSGVGRNYVYFMRYLSAYSVTTPTEIEVIKCVLRE